MKSNADGQLRPSMNSNVSFRIYLYDIFETGQLPQCVPVEATQATLRNNEYVTYRWTNCTHQPGLGIAAVDTGNCIEAGTCPDLAFGYDTACTWTWTSVRFGTTTQTTPGFPGSAVQVTKDPNNSTGLSRTASYNTLGGGEPPPHEYDNQPVLQSVTCHGSIVDRIAGRAIYTH